MHLTKRRGFWGISMEDVGVLWVWGFRGDFYEILLYGMGMGIETQSPRQPWIPCRIGYWRDAVLTLFVWLSVCDEVYCSVQGRYGRLRVVPSCVYRALPIHFFRRFCCRMYRLATNGEKTDRHKK